MQLHQIRPKHKNKKKKRVGRGGKRGTYSGRGLKGQKSRAGRKLVPVVRELIKRYPKLRGYRAETRDKDLVCLDINFLEKKFNDLDVVSPKILLERKLIRRIKGKAPNVKILGKGNLTKKLMIENCQLSKSAREAIEKAGGGSKIKFSISNFQ